MRTLLALAVLLLLPATAAYAVPGDQATFDRGVAAYDAKNYEEAFKIFSDLAENEDVAAMRNVALMYRRGQGVARDPKKALKWYGRAAVAGLGTAQADLGIMLLDGEAGKTDPEEAVHWLTLASEAGHAIAQFRLGELYEKGEYVKQNLDLAKKLYAEAAAHGHKEAAARLAALGGDTAKIATAPPEAPPSNVVTQPLPFPAPAEATSQTPPKPKLASIIIPLPLPRPALPIAPDPQPEATPTTITPGATMPQDAGTRHKTFKSPKPKQTP